MIGKLKTAEHYCLFGDNVDLEHIVDLFGNQLDRITVCVYIEACEQGHHHSDDRYDRE